MPKIPSQETETPLTAPEPPASSFEDTVLNLLGQMTDQIKSLGARVEAVESRPEAPQFIDPRVHVNGSAYERSQRALGDQPDGIPKSMTIPLFPNGQKVPDMVMNMIRPKFGSGDWVRLDLDAVPEGRDDGRTRGELMAEKGIPAGIGRVLDRTFLSERADKKWKYRVQFPKESMPGCNRGINHFYERELLRA